MLALDDIRLRPLELADIDRLHAWHQDPELEILSGWGPRRSRGAFEKKWRHSLLASSHVTRQAMRKTQAVAACRSGGGWARYSVPSICPDPPVLNQAPRPIVIEAQ